MNDCHVRRVTCLNGGHCLDLLSDFRCVCLNHFTGSHCQDIDSNVCQNQNQSAISWRFSSFNCTKVCLCREGVLKCQQCELNSSNRCEKRRPTVRVLFSQHVPNACHTLFTIHSLIGGNSEDFCCEENSGKFEVLFDSGLRTEMEALVTSGQLWPDFRELKAISESKDNYYFEILLIIICLIIVLIIVFSLLFHFFWRNVLLRRESPEVTINCIQNNLRQENTNNCKLL